MNISIKEIRDVDKGTEYSKEYDLFFRMHSKRLSSINNNNGMSRVVINLSPSELLLLKKKIEEVFA